MLLALSCVLLLVCALGAHHEQSPRKKRSFSEPFDPDFLFRHDGSYTPTTITDDTEGGESYFNNDYFVMPSYSEQSSIHVGDVFDLKPKYIDLLESSKINYANAETRADLSYQAPQTYRYDHDLHVDRARKNPIYYDQLPYYHHNPHEYEQMKIDSEIEKAKDKRYAVDAARIIPIHEDLSGDVPHPYDPIITTPYYHSYEEPTTENPLSGHDPFFSFTLNNLFNDDSYDDHISFKGDWGRDFDHQTLNQGIDELPKVGRRVLSNVNYYDAPVVNYHLDSGEISDKHSVMKDNNKDLVINKHEKENVKNENDEARYKNSGSDGMIYKNFLDTFTNKYGSGDQKKHLKYMTKKNEGKGENRKGFRRVYHKDEYQEDNEFYDNNNSSALAEEAGIGHRHLGGSEGLLASHAVAQQGDKSNAYDISKNNENKNHQKYYNGHLNRKDLDFSINRADAIRNVPKRYPV